MHRSNEEPHCDADRFIRVIHLIRDALGAIVLHQFEYDDKPRRVIKKWLLPCCAEQAEIRKPLVVGARVIELALFFFGCNANLMFERGV